MIVNATALHQDCPAGQLSELEFDIKYGYSGSTRCMHSGNSFFPTEYTETVERLITYNTRANETYGQCILNMNCSGEVNLTEWRQLAINQYKACSYCDQENVTADDPCDSTTMVVERSEPDLLLEILNSIFLVVSYRCDIQIENSTRYALATIKPPQVYKRPYSMEVELECDDPLQQPQVVELVEQVEGYRRQTKSNKAKLIRHINQNISAEHTNGNRTVRLGDADIFSIAGGLQGKLYPTKMDIYYQCKNISKKNQMTPASERQTGELERGMTILVASCSAAAILVLGILAMTITVLYRHHKRSRGTFSTIA